MVVGDDRNNLGVCHSNRRVERGELEMLLMLLWAVMTAREGEDQGIIALKPAEPVQIARVTR